MLRRRQSHRWRKGAKERGTQILRKAAILFVGAFRRRRRRQDFIGGARRVAFQVRAGREKLEKIIKSGFPSERAVAHCAPFVAVVVAATVVVIANNAPPQPQPQPQQPSRYISFHSTFLHNNTLANVSRILFVCVLQSSAAAPQMPPNDLLFVCANTCLSSCARQSSGCFCRCKMFKRNTFAQHFKQFFKRR